MKLLNAKLGDKYFGLIHTYSFHFLKGIKIVEFEIIKVTLRTVKISFDTHTKKYPQVMMKNKENSCINDDPIKLLNNYMTFLLIAKYPDYLKERIKKYCLRKIKYYNDINYINKNSVWKFGE